MSLPPSFLDELRGRISLSQVAGRKVVWDARKSNQTKGDMWAPCPFHQEKTASFHVDDRKGFYYCFGCHAKGDAISFVRETENVGFMEAIEILAREAGMSVPAPDPKAREKADRRAELTEVMEQAVRYFRLQLKTAAAAEARAYLESRGVTEATRDRFEIGFAPDAKQGLYRHLTGKGVVANLISDAGLCIKPEDGGAPYDRFRGRIVFPIRDVRSRAIALGGRAMDPNARAKYLNSPETMLFDKGRNLYNQGPARDAVGKGQSLIVVEGYMDVIALTRAGFEAAVAPLGTAITAEQLRLMWRITPYPVIALDGDEAGLRAARRLMDTALPMLEAGRSLNFALLPRGQDPDDLLRTGGIAAFQKVLDDAQPMIAMLWERERDAEPCDTPERKAGLGLRLNLAIGKIRDGAIKKYYREAIREFWQRDFRAESLAAFYKPNRAAPGARSETKRSFLASSVEPFALERIREMAILAVLVKSPALIEAFVDGLEDFDFRDETCRRLVTSMLHPPDDDPKSDEPMSWSSPGVEEEIRTVMDHPLIKVVPAVREPGDPERSRMTVAREMAFLEADRRLRSAVDEFVEELYGIPGERATYEIGKLTEEKDRALAFDDDENDEIEIGPNGFPVSRKERSDLDSIIGKARSLPSKGRW